MRTSSTGLGFSIRLLHHFIPRAVDGRGEWKVPEGAGSIERHALPPWSINGHAVLTLVALELDVGLPLALQMPLLDGDSDAASAPAAFPADGTASFFKPSFFATVTATAMPHALKLCVGFCDSSLIHSRSLAHACAESWHVQ
jgi:hypothetical protein